MIIMLAAVGATAFTCSLAGTFVGVWWGTKVMVTAFVREVK